MIKLGIADDHKLLVDGLKLVLEQEDDIAIVAIAYSAQELLKQLESVSLDILLLDIDLPDLDGISTCKKVKSKYPTLKVIALTTFDKGAFIQQMLKAGALGYVIKSAASEELVTAIRTVLTGEIYLSKNAHTALLNTLRNDSTPDLSFIPDLTPRENEVLQLIAAEFTTKEIAQQLHLSEHTIETHRRNLLSKFSVRNVAGLIKVALKRGLIK